MLSADLRSMCQSWGLVLTQHFGLGQLFSTTTEDGVKVYSLPSLKTVQYLPMWKFESFFMAAFMIMAHVDLIVRRLHSAHKYVPSVVLCCIQSTMATSLRHSRQTFCGSMYDVYVRLSICSVGFGSYILISGGGSLISHRRLSAAWIKRSSRLMSGLLFDESRNSFRVTSTAL